MEKNAPRTKIVCTIGPATNSPAMLKQLILGGMDVARLNMSHSPADQVRQDVANLRRLSAECDCIVSILMDLQGPAIRTGVLPAPLTLKPGDRLALTVGPTDVTGMPVVDVNYESLVDDLNEEDMVVVDNGTIELKVIEKRPHALICEALSDGVLGNRRHINLPGIRVKLPALTEKDLAAVQLGLETKVDFFALSFCREASDVVKLKELIRAGGGTQRVIAKLENQQGVNNLEDIISVVDGVMVARGDLGIEVPYEELPIIQRHVVRRCRARGCPVIVATHMLESMIENPSPTRAEITDVANACTEQADAIMLSGETSVGHYPLKCLSIMNRIARRIEETEDVEVPKGLELDTLSARLMKAATVLATEIKARALVLFTETGSMPRYAAWFRPRHTPIYAFTNNPVLLTQLPLHWGTTPLFIPFDQENPLANVDTAMAVLTKLDIVANGDKVVIATQIRMGDRRLHTLIIKMVGDAGTEYGVNLTMI